MAAVGAAVAAAANEAAAKDRLSREKKTEAHIPPLLGVAPLGVLSSPEMSWYSTTKTD